MVRIKMTKVDKRYGISEIWIPCCNCLFQLEKMKVLGEIEKQFDLKCEESGIVKPDFPITDDKKDAWEKYAEERNSFFDRHNYSEKMDEIINSLKIALPYEMGKPKDNDTYIVVYILAQRRIKDSSKHETKAVGVIRWENKQPTLICTDCWNSIITQPEMKEEFGKEKLRIFDVSFPNDKLLYKASIKMFEVINK